MNTTADELQLVEVNGRRVAYREAGSGPPVLLIHGWPTSSFLWRAMMPAIAERNRVLAIDLPGFGASDKPLDVTYNFAFFEEMLDGFLAALAIDDLAIGAHDIGGPIAVHWTLHRLPRVSALALLNTLLYPEFHATVREFIRVLSSPHERENLTSDKGLEMAMRLGVAQADRVTPEAIAGVAEPFVTGDDRLALARAGIELEPAVFAEIALSLHRLRMPVRILYGEQDRFLPDVQETFGRLAREVSQVQVTSIPNGGHFVQEDEPQQVAEQLARFFAAHG